MEPTPIHTTIEGFYDWGPGVVLTADCLGEAYRTELAGYQLTVTIPPVQAGQLVEPPTIYVRPGNWVNVDPPNPWGDLRVWSTTEGGSPVPHTACVRRVRLTLEIRDTEVDENSLGPRLDDVLAPWWDALSSWIEVITSQDLAAAGQRRPTRPQTFHLWSGNPDGTMRPLAMMLRGTGYPTTDVLTSDGLRACLSAVARGEAPAPERLHLSDARSLHNDGQWRRAVIDAATAAEVAITSWLDKRLDAAEPVVKESLMDPPPTLGRLHRLYTRLGGALPSDFDRRLVRPRNHAAHRGMALSEEESLAAINAATELLDATSPIPL